MVENRRTKCKRVGVSMGWAHFRKSINCCLVYHPFGVCVTTWNPFIGIRCIWFSGLIMMIIIISYHNWNNDWLSGWIILISHISVIETSLCFVSAFWRFAPSSKSLLHLIHATATDVYANVVMHKCAKYELKAKIY